MHEFALRRLTHVTKRPSQLEGDLDRENPAKIESRSPSTASAHAGATKAAGKATNLRLDKNLRNPR